MEQDAKTSERAASRSGEHDARVRRLRRLLESRGAAAGLLAARRNVAWLTVGASGHIDQSTEASVASILVARDDVVVITQNIEAARFAEEELAGLDVQVVAVPWWEPGAIEAEVRRRVRHGDTIDRDVDLEPDLGHVRSVLSDFDRARMRELGQQVTSAMEAALASTGPGMSEHAVAADLAARLPGVRVPVLLVAADARIRLYRHPLPSDTRIRARVMVVVVAERWGLHVARTRLREFEPPDADLARRLEAVAAVQDAMHAATTPGATLAAVLDAARSTYAGAGFPDEWRDHHQGGTIGYRPRERIAIPGDPAIVSAGMAFAWNPSIAGAKAEDTILVREDGEVEVITGTSATVSP